MFRIDPSIYLQQSSLASTIRQQILETNHTDVREKVIRLHSQRLRVAAHSLIDILSPDFDRKFNLFIMQYANSLPKLIDTLSERCKQSGWDELLHQLESVISAFFRPIDHKTELGLFGILDRLYFAHRLVEEIHDFLMAKTGQPILKWDMTTANLVVHQLLGEEYAARLDQVSVEAGQKMFASIKQAGKPTESSLHHSAAHWPCFCEQAGLSLALY